MVQFVCISKKSMHLKSSALSSFTLFTETYNSISVSTLNTWFNTTWYISYIFLELPKRHSLTVIHIPTFTTLSPSLHCIPNLETFNSFRTLYAKHSQTRLLILMQQTNSLPLRTFTILAFFYQYIPNLVSLRTFSTFLTSPPLI